jgi:hypothetical protein
MLLSQILLLNMNGKGCRVLMNSELHQYQEMTRNLQILANIFREKVKQSLDNSYVMNA